MNKKSRNEKGQIIVILALAMVAMIAITALAIDGSLIYNQRRVDQSTADSASLAGAGAAADHLKAIKPSEFSCGSGIGAEATVLAINAAIQSAQDDSVTLQSFNSLASLQAAKHGIRIECGTDSLGTHYLDIHVWVSSTPSTSFAKIIGVDTLNTTVRSVARVYPTQSFAFGNALVSCSSTCSTKSGGIEFGGTGFTFINSGGVWSNSCIKAASASTVVDVDGSISFINPEPDGCFQCEDANMDPPPTQATTPLDCFAMMSPIETCENAEDGKFVNVPSTADTIGPGFYKNGINTGNGDDLNLEPGLYCIKGGMTNNAKSNLSGDGVTLYFLSGDVTLNTNDKPEEPFGVDLSAPDCSGQPTCGLLMYFSTSYSPVVKINGGAKNSFEGTIFGPTANITINGGSDTSTFKTQIIGNWIEVTGKSSLQMDLDGSLTAKQPAKLSLLR